MNNDLLHIAGRSYQSRLLVGTGKYQDLEETRLAIEASGAEIVTVAVRRTNIGQNPNEPNLLEVVSPQKYTILPNTAGCYTAEDAIRTCRLARELLDGHNLVKLEVLGDEKTLYPNIVETLKSAEVLVKEGFEVMVYTSDDPIVAKQLEEIGCVAVMPLGSLIGSGLGIINPYNLRIIMEQANVPIIVDAGVGTASDAAIAMELGCAGVLMNTAIAKAQKPILMASAMKKAVEAGRESFLAGRMPKKLYASASSPLEGKFFNMTELVSPKAYPRRIMTFMRRSTAYTVSQQKGLDEYGEYYLLETEQQTFNQQNIFGRIAPLTVEIGFGMGSSLIQMAEAAPERDFIGIEIHPNGLAQICFEAGERKLSNLRVIEGDALLLLEHYFVDNSIDTVQLYFADPWPKKKHHKRRFVQLDNMQLIRQKLKMGGVFHAATDWEHYALWMLEILEASEGYKNVLGKGQFSPRPDYRPLTKFEVRGQKLGHGVWDVLYQRVS